VQKRSEITAAKNLTSAPKTLLASPGPGKAIVIVISSAPTSTVCCASDPKPQLPVIMFTSVTSFRFPAS